MSEFSHSICCEVFFCLLEKTFAHLSLEHREALQRLRLNQRFLNPEPVVQHLSAIDVLSMEEKESILAINTRTGQGQGQCQALLDVIEQKPDWVYSCLVNALHSTEQPHVVQILDGGVLQLLSNIYSRYYRPI